VQVTPAIVDVLIWLVIVLFQVGLFSLVINSGISANFEQLGYSGFLLCVNSFYLGTFSYYLKQTYIK